MKERLRDFDRCSGAGQARQMLEELKDHCLKPSMPPEVQRLGRTVKAWFDKICNYHLARMTNCPTEALNNLIKRVKRLVGFQRGAGAQRVEAGPRRPGVARARAECSESSSQICALGAPGARWPA